MRRAHFLTVGLGVLAAAALRAQDPPKVTDALDALWRTDLSRAREEAREAKKPLLVVFRCPP